MLNMTIDQILPGTAKRLPGKIALIFGERTITYGELERLTNQAANGLKALDVSKGDRVTLFAPNSVEWVISYIGIAKAGGVINPVNAMLTAEELAYVVKDCSAKVLMTTAERAAAAQHLKNGGDLKEIVVLGGPVTPGTISFDDMLSGQANTIEPPGNVPKGLSTICYTSGTTGFPKGAMLDHRSVVLNAAMTAAMNVRTERDVQFTGLPLPHVYGTVVMNLSFLLGPHFRDAGKIRCPAGPGIDRASQGQHHRRRADNVSLYAGASRFRQIRLVVVARRRGRRTIHAGGEIGGMAETQRRAHSGTVGHDGAGRSRHHAAFLLREPAGLGRHHDALHAGPYRRPVGCIENTAGWRSR